MEGYKSMLKRLNSLIDALEKGALSIDELSELEEITRNLHERSIILRYTAFKEMVLPNEPNENTVEEVAVPPVLVPEPEPELEPESEIEEETTFDFSIFGDDEAEEEIPESVIEEEVIPEPVVEMVEEVPAPEPVVEAPKVEVPKVEAPIIETPKIEEIVPERNSDLDDSSFLERLKLPDTMLTGRFGATKLDSLIGAFGLNERLRYINDLFDGSSEFFSEAIKTLDSQNDLKSARLKAAFFADKHSWDPEDDVVIEFMSYLNRRYA